MIKSRSTILLCLLCSAAGAQPPERIHSDLPLLAGRKGELQPVHFSDKDGFGCSSRVAFGDWKYVHPNKDSEPYVEWLRLRNYGVFHCAAIEEWAYDREHLGRTGFKYSWFVNLGGARRGKSTVELWALQSGSRPGSDYLLLTRTSGPGLIKSFDVLPVECPRQDRRSGDGPDIWRADYCAVNSVAEFRALAHSMAKRAPVGTLTFVAEAQTSDDDD